MDFVAAANFDQWRHAARILLAAEVPPCDVQWSDPAAQAPLFDSELPDAKVASSVTVPPAFMELARQVACHRDPVRWPLLYQALWRLAHGERYLLELTTDLDVHALGQMRKAVTRDVHKMKAFVRFRKVVGPDQSEQYIAWHRPDHRIVPLAAPFFARRFPAMNWSILTPDASVTWDLIRLDYGPGVPVSAAPDADVLEDLWRAYYASIFNPARVNTAQMKREMPVRHWPTLPEASLIPELLQQAAARVTTMIDTHEGFAQTAAAFLPMQRDLTALAQAAHHCTACDLHCHATQTVFGEGPSTARIVLVGEQPGDQEDLQGRPFVGTAGQLLDAALLQAGVDRQQVYVTNVVKHFKYEPRGKRRLHSKPDSREIGACLPWLEAELQAIGPATLVCLGATAAQALLGRDFRIMRQRGQVVASRWCPQTIATWHPAAILRTPDEQDRARRQAELTADLALALT